MKILIIGESENSKSITAYNKTHVAQIKKIAPKAEIILTDDPKKVARQLPTADIIITSPFLANLIDLNRTKNLKWVHFSSAGVTDIAKILAPTPILLTNSSGVHPIPISEHVAAFMLMFARQINKSYRTQIEAKKWNRDTKSLDVFEMASATVGIVGLGRIGSRVAQISKGLGAKVIAFEHDRKVRDKNIDKTYKNLEQLLKVSTFVVNCLPLTPATEGFFDMKKFKLMKPTSYFINIGRGKTVTEQDLIKALKDGTIAGAGLDVFETEPLTATSELWKLENVIITPHYSGWTPEYTNRVVDIFCSNLNSYLKNKPMPTLVDKKRGY